MLLHSFDNKLLKATDMNYTTRIQENPDYSFGQLYLSVDYICMCPTEN